MWEIGNSKNIIYFYTKTIRSEQRRNDSCDKEFELEAVQLLDCPVSTDFFPCFHKQEHVS